MSTRFALTGAPDDEEAAAAIAAVLAALEAEAVALTPAEQAAPRQGWHASARLITQGLAPSRLPATPTWGRVERLRRAGRGGSGIVGQ